MFLLLLIHLLCYFISNFFTLEHNFQFARVGVGVHKKATFHLSHVVGKFPLNLPCASACAS